MRIRDHMDDILEARGYYRKHVAHEPDSLFRSVADVMFHTQQHTAGMLKFAARAAAGVRDRDVRNGREMPEEYWQKEVCHAISCFSFRLQCHIPSLNAVLKKPP